MILGAACAVLAVTIEHAAAADGAAPSPARGAAPLAAITAGPPIPVITTPVAGAAVPGTFTVAGSAEPHAEVVVRADGEPAAAGPAGADGAFSFELTLSEGARALTVTATDADGNVSLPATLTVLVDTTAPVVAIYSGPDRPINTLSATFTFVTNEAGARFECALARAGDPAPEPGPCTSPVTYDGLVRGSAYTFAVRAYDAAGNYGDASRSFNVTEVGPATFIDPLPPLSAETSVHVTWTGAEGAVKFECRHVFPESLGGPEEDREEVLDDCPLPWPITDMIDGLHRFEVRAFDADGNVGHAASTEILIDALPPPEVTPTRSGDTITFAPSEPGVTFECRLEGAGGHDFAPCTSPYSLAGLRPGDYSFTLRAIDVAGNPVDAPPLRFTVAPPAASPTPTPTPTPQAAPAPTATPTPDEAPAPRPESKRTVLLRTVSGKVRARRPGGAFETVSRTQAFPLGTIVDAKAGRVQLTVEPRPGRPAQRLLVSGGVFRVTHTGATVDLTLTEQLAPCSGKRSRSGAKSRRLLADGKGKFRVRGRYASASARGTIWLVQDSCAGTLTQVRRGVVAVRDQVRGRTVLVRAGKKYLAKPRR
jgi:hypothetical protein